MVQEEAHKITELRDFRGEHMLKFRYLVKENTVYTCTCVQQHNHILPCDSTLTTPTEVKTSSMMVAAVMVPY